MSFLAVPSVKRMPWGLLGLVLNVLPIPGVGGFVYTGDLTQVGVQATGLLAVGVFTFSASFAALWLMKATVGIRVDEEGEHLGLDVAEHGMPAPAELVPVLEAA